jgi:hypothetical protein
VSDRYDRVKKAFMAFDTDVAAIHLMECDGCDEGCERAAEVMWDFSRRLLAGEAWTEDQLWLAWRDWSKGDTKLINYHVENAVIGFVLAVQRRLLGTDGECKPGDMVKRCGACGTVVPGDATKCWNCQPTDGGEGCQTVTCCVSSTCEDDSCEHRKPHRVFQHDKADHALPCTEWCECDSAPNGVDVRCAPRPTDEPCGTVCQKCGKLGNYSLLDCPECTGRQTREGSE